MFNGFVVGKEKLLEWHKQAKKPNVSKDKLSKQVAGKISNFIFTFCRILRKQATKIALNPVQTAAAATVAAN